MADTSKVITQQRYSQGVSYETYIGQLGETKKRFDENSKAFHLAQEDALFFKDIVRDAGPIKILAIVEDWCTDVHRGLPIMAAIALASGMELRIFPRDKNPDIMNLYLNQGKFMSIPVFAFFDKDLKPLAHWIERPAAASHAIEEIMAELTKKKLSEEDIRQMRRERTASLFGGWRQETVNEFKDLLGKATKKR